jgi:hypothetical protein
MEGMDVEVFHLKDQWFNWDLFSIRTEGTNALNFLEYTGSISGKASERLSAEERRAASMSRITLSFEKAVLKEKFTLCE